MNRSNDTRDALEPTHVATVAPAERRYKACRTCRRQKMRCDGADRAPCRRCVRAKVTCVFDETPARVRPSPVRGLPKKHTSQRLTSEIAGLRMQIALLTRDNSQSLQQVSRQSTPERDQGAMSSQTRPDHDLESLQDHVFSPENLGIPVTAVHVMMHPPNDGGAERNEAGWTVENQSRWHKEENKDVVHPDILSSGAINDNQARSLFDLYMHRANIFLPIFDPIVDTYESLQENSPFSFAVILYVAARHEFRNDPRNELLRSCKEQVYLFAAQSLFENPSSLETAEAMAILASHSEKTWFALGHACQIAKDLGLDVKLQGSASASSNIATTPKQTRFALRCARTLLLIIQYDRSIAFGSKREPRTNELSSASMEHFLRHTDAHPSDITACAAIDLVQYLMRVQVSTEIVPENIVDDTVGAWHARWDSCLEDCYVHRDSFQRSYLKIQGYYARIVCNGMLFARLGKSRNQSETTIDRDLTNVASRIVYLVRDLLEYVDGCGPFKRIFSWAPTYEGLLLTFVLVLGMQVLRMYPASGDTEALLKQVEHANLLLEQHPCTGFHKVVQVLIRRSRPTRRTANATTHENSTQATDQDSLDLDSILQREDWMYELTALTCSNDNSGF